MNILQKKEIIDFCDLNKLSTRKVAQIYGVKFGRPIHHSSICKILKQRTEILSTAADELQAEKIRVKSSVEEKLASEENPENLGPSGSHT